MPAGDRSAADLADLDALRIDALTWLAPSISHELANPLGAVVGFSGVLARDPRLPPDLRDDVRMLRDEAERTSRIVRTVLELLRDRPAVMAPVDVAILLDEVLALAAARTTDVEVARSVEDPPPVAETDPSRLRQLLLALVVEALRGLGERPRGGRVEVSIRTATPGRITTAFEYRPGPAAVQGDPHIAAGEIPVPMLGATLRVERSATGGRLTLDLPATATDAAGVPPAGMPPAGMSSAGRARLTVLVCDDEDAIRALLVRVLERDGVRVISAADGPTALAAIEAQSVDAVITDHRMTGMSGVELYARAIELRPGLRTRFVVTSGEPGADELRELTDRTGVMVLAKPFDVPGIPALIRQLARDGRPGPQRG